MKMIQHTITTLLAAAALASFAGCQPNGSTAAPADDFFTASEDSTRSFDILAAQSASGARGDGMLYPSHFTGPSLNSLGAAKLDRMLNDDDPCEPLTVYLSVADDAQTAARKSAITAYLKDRGLKAEQIQVVTGANPNSSHPAAPLLQRMDRTESAPGTSGYGSTSGSSGTTGGSSGGMTSSNSSGSSGSSGSVQGSGETARLVGN